MGLTSFTFLGFLFCFLIIYFLIPKKIQWLFLAITSFFFLFYNDFSIVLLFYVLLVLFFSYISGLLIEKNRNSKKAFWLCVISVLIIILQLIFLKYTNLFGITLKHLADLFGLSFAWDNVYRVAPLGVSYYSLIMIGYIIDIYRGIIKPQKNILKCALFMLYFPQLTSGPFTRYGDMEQKLYEAHRFNYKGFTDGLLRVAWGFFKILVISQRLGIYVDGVYNNLGSYGGFYVLIAIAFYTVQLYTNFSGSIDIVLGVSEIIGIKLPENFQTPFFSKSISEFWRRWHITLGQWLKDFIFYPLLKSNFIQNMTKKLKNILGKNLGKKIPLYLSMLILWITIGIWHGGAYNYIIASGLLQFLFIFVEDISEPLVKKVNAKLHINMEAFSYKLFQCIKTFLLFSFAMVFFRAGSCSMAIDIIRSAFNTFNPWILFDMSIYNVGLDRLDFIVLIGSLVVLFVVEWLQRTGSVREKLNKQNLIFRWIIIYILLFSIIVFGCYGPGYDATTFIYRQF